jgi:hypothetical protein
MEEAKNIAENAKNTFMATKYTSLIAEVKSKLADGKAKGWKIADEVEPLLAATDKLLAEGAYDKLEPEVRKIESAIEAGRQAAREAAAPVIEAVEALIAELKQSGADVEQITELVTDMKTAFEDEAYSKAVEVAKNVEATANKIKAEFYHTEAAKSVTETEVLLTEIKSGELSEDAKLQVSTAEKHVADAKTALTEKNYELVNTEIAKARDALKDLSAQYYSKKAEDNIIKVQTAISDAKNVGADTKDAEQLLEAGVKAYQSKEFERAVEELNAAQKAIDQALEFKRAVDILQDVRGKIVALKDKGVDITELEKRFADAKPAFAEKRYADAIKIARAVNELAQQLEEETTINRVSEVISRVEKLITDCKSLSIDVASSTALLEQAKTAVDEKKYDEAMKLAQDAEQEVERVRADKLKPIVTEGIIKVQAQIGKFKAAGLATERVEATFSELGTAFAANEFSRAAELLDECKRQLEGLEEYNKVAVEVNAAKTKLDAVAKLGVDLSGVQELYEKAQSALEHKDYEGAIEYSKLCVAEAAKLEHKELAQDLIQLAETKLRDARALGVDISSAEELHTLARTAMDEHEFEKSMDYAKKCVDEIERLDQLYPQAQESIKSAERFIAELSESGLEFSVPQQLLADAKHAFESGEYGKAVELARQSETESSRLRQEYERIADSIKLAQERINYAKQLGINVSKAEELFANIQPALDNKSYADAMEYAKLSFEEADRLCKDYDRIAGVVQLSRSKIAVAKNLGADVGRAEKLYSEVQTAISKGDYDKAFALAKQAGEEADRTKAEYQELSEVVQIAQTRISELKNKGLKTDDIMRLFDLIATAMDAGDYAQAKKYAIQTAEEAKVLGEYHENVMKLIEEAREKITSAKVIGANVTTIEETFSRIDGFIRENDYDRAMAVAKRCSTEAERIRSQHQEAINLIRVTWSRLTDAKRIGADTTTAEQLLSEARNSIKDGNYDTAVNLARQSAADMVQKLRR